MKPEFFKRNKSKKKVLVLTTPSTTGVEYHRLLQPSKLMNELHGDDYEVTISVDLSQFKEKELKKFQFCLVSGLFSDAVYLHLKKNGVKILLDMDDLWWTEEYFHLHHTHKATGRAISTQRCLLLADAIITTNERLAGFIRNVNDNVHIIPNGIDPDLPQWERKLNTQPFTRFGIIGSVSHISDIPLLKPSLDRLIGNMELAERWQIALGGFTLESEYYQQKEDGSLEKVDVPLNQNDWVRIESLVTNDWRVLKGKAIAGYAQHMMKFDSKPFAGENIMPYRRMWTKDVNNYARHYDEIDVLLVPLRNDPFNQCKSELKLIEAGFKKKAVICSDVAPYSQFTDKMVYKVTPGSEATDFFKHMRQTIVESNEATDKAEALHEYVSTKFNLKRITEARVQLYDQIIDQWNK